MTNKNIVAEMKFNIELNFKITEKGKKYIDEKGMNLEDLTMQFKESLREIILDEVDDNEPELINYDLNIISELIKTEMIKLT